MLQIKKWIRSKGSEPIFRNRRHMVRIYIRSEEGFPKRVVFGWTFEQGEAYIYFGLFRISAFWEREPWITAENIR